MRKILAPLIILFGFALNATAATPDEIAQAWKERGFVAISRLDSLLEKNDKKSQYQYLLEFAFAMHATTDKSNKFGFVHKFVDNLDFYKIILNKVIDPKSKTEVDDAGLFSINYIYNHKTGEYVGAKIELLPKGWYIERVSDI